MGTEIKPILIEYTHPISLWGTKEVSWAPIRVIHELQKLTMCPLILILAPPSLQNAAGKEKKMPTMKNDWLEAARLLTLMTAAAGVGFVPLMISSIHEKGNTLIRAEYRDESLQSWSGLPTREHHRRSAGFLNELVTHVQKTFIHA